MAIARSFAAALWLGAAVMAGCAHERGVTLEKIAGLPARVELGDTPFFPQERFQCGPAALATLLQAAGHSAHPDDLAPQVYLPGRRGSLQAELVAAARARGLVVVEIAPEFDALLAEIAAGHPVLVLQNLGLDALPRWHYAVAVGYDRDAEDVILRSGALRRRVTPFVVFERTWARGERWGVVVLEPGALPARARPAAYLDAVSALEAQGQLDAARRGYLAASARWPERFVAWLGLGNVEYARGRHADAEVAFRRAIDAAPGEFSAWNNLAHALAARQCVAPALESARCASSLAPRSPVPAQTLQDIAALASAPEALCAPPPACPRAVDQRAVQ